MLICTQCLAHLWMAGEDKADGCKGNASIRCQTNPFVEYKLSRVVGGVDP